MQARVVCLLRGSRRMDSFPIGCAAGFESTRGLGLPFAPFAGRIGALCVQAGGSPRCGSHLLGKAHPACGMGSRLVSCFTRWVGNVAPCCGAVLRVISDVSTRSLSVGMRMWSAPARHIRSPMTPRTVGKRASGDILDHQSNQVIKRGPLAAPRAPEPHRSTPDRVRTSPATSPRLRDGSRSTLSFAGSSRDVGCRHCGYTTEHRPR